GIIFLFDRLLFLNTLLPGRIEKISDNLIHLGRFHMTISLFVYLDNRRKCAATQAGNFLNREEIVGRTVPLFCDFEISFECFRNQLGSFYMACGPGADFYCVFPRWYMPELGIKC